MRRPVAAEAAVVYACLAAIIAAQVYLLTRSLHTKTVFDEGVYLLALDALRHGQALGREVFTSQGPLFYVLLRVIGAVFDVSVAGVRLGMVTVAALGTLFAFLLGRRVGGPLTGLACAAFLAMAPKLSYFGAGIYADMPAMVLVVASLYLVSRRMAYAAGAVFAAAVLVKLSALTALPTVVALLALEQPRTRRLLDALAGAAGVVIVTALVFVHDLRGIWTGAVTYHLRSRHEINDLSGRHELFGFFSVNTPFFWVVVAGLVATAFTWRRLWPYWLWAALASWFEVEYVPLRENQIVVLPFSFAIATGLALGLAAQRLPRRLVLPAAGAVALACAAGWLQQYHLVTRDMVTPENPALVQAAAELRRVTRPNDLVISDQPIVAFLAHRHTPGRYVDMASLRFDTHTLSDADLERDSKRVAAVVVGRALLTHHELQALFERRFPHRAVLPGATIYYR